MKRLALSLLLLLTACAAPVKADTAVSNFTDSELTAMQASGQAAVKAGLSSVSVQPMGVMEEGSDRVVVFVVTASAYNPDTNKLEEFKQLVYMDDGAVTIPHIYAFNGKHG